MSMTTSNEVHGLTGQYSGIISLTTIQTIKLGWFLELF